MDNSAPRTSESAYATALLAADDSTPPAFWGTVAIFVLLALVPTFWPEFDLVVAANFMGQEPAIKSASWWWVVLINEDVPLVFRCALGLCFAGWLFATLKPTHAQWRLPLAFVVVAGILGPGAVVNLVFKDHWQRARPYQVEAFGGPLQFTRAAVITDQCNNNCSFVSGHVACGAFLVALGLVHRRRRVAWALAGTAAGLVIAFARFSDKAHWLSDALWAFPITLGTCWLVWKALLWLYAKPWRTVA
jgi:lipid A 4'-phosphatase